MDGWFDRFGSCLINNHTYRNRPKPDKWNESKYELLSNYPNPKEQNKETNAETNRETDRQTRFKERKGKQERRLGMAGRSVGSNGVVKASAKLAKEASAK